jgi:zinc protease
VAPIALALALAASVSGWAKVSPPPPQEGEFRVPSPARTVLKNGLTLLIQERRSIPLVEFRLLLKAGAVSDPEGKGGTAGLTARLLKRGTRTRSARQFAEEVEFVGGRLETEAGVEATAVSGEFAARDFEVGLSLLSDMVQNPAFTDEELLKQRDLAAAELVAELDDPGSVADRAFAAWLYGTHPYGRPAQGSKESVARLARSDVAAFHAAFYAPNNAILAIVGDVDASRAVLRADHYFSGWKRRTLTEPKFAEALPAKGRRILLLDKPDATQSQIRFGNLAVRRGDPDYFPLQVANAILGRGFTSWLVDEVRVKRGLTYGIGSTLTARRVAGSFEVATFSKNASVVETLTVSLDQIKRLRNEPVPAADLDRARSFLAGQFPLQIESPDDLAVQIVEVEFYGLPADYLNQYQKRVRGVAAETVRRTSGRLNQDDMAIVVVGPAASLREPLSRLGTVTVRPVESGPGPSQRGAAASSSAFRATLESGLRASARRNRSAASRASPSTRRSSPR